MIRSRLLPFALLSLFPLAASNVACVAQGDDASDTSDSEDAFSGSTMQNLGAIAYGEARDATYTSTPTYRAYTFDGAAGDKVDFTVTSNDGAPLAWLLSSTYGYVATGDANHGGQHATHVATTLKKAGSYLIVFREYARHDATFHVALNTSAAPPPPPPTDGDPFDPNYCTGASISRAEFLARFAPGETTAKLGDITLRVRQRQCQDQTGCQDWVDATSAPFYVVTYGSNGYYTSNPTNLSVPAKGSANISVGSSSMGIDLALANASGFDISSSTNSSDTPAFDFRMPRVNNQSVQIGSWLSSPGNYQSFYQKKITGTCVQALSSGKVYDPQGNGRYVEYSASLAGKYAAKTPDPQPVTPKGDVFDPTWCSGPAITRSQILSKFAPAATEASLGRVTLEGRQRECQDQTGCQAWNASTKLPFYTVTYGSNGYYTSNPVDVSVPASGPINLTVGSSSVAIAIGLDNSSFSLGSSTNMTDTPSFDFRMPRLNNASVEVGSWLSSPGNYQSFYQKNITDSCLQALSSGKVYAATGNGQYTEYTVSLHAQY